MLSGPNPFIQNIVNQSYAPQTMSMTGGMAPNPFQSNTMMSNAAFAAAPNFAMNPMFNTNTNSKMRKLYLILVFNEKQIVLFLLKGEK